MVGDIDKPERAGACHGRVEPDWQNWVRVLERDGRDIDGKLLKRGTSILCHPSDPEAFREDTPANRQEFLRLDGSWTLSTRQRVWFPPLAALPIDLTGEAERGRSAARAFLAAIGENILSAKGEPIPEVKLLPFWSAILAWEPRIRCVGEVADLTDRLADRLADKSGVPQQVAWPDEWRQWLAGLNGLKVYALSGMTVTVHVIAAVPACVRFQAAGRPELSSPRQETVDLIRDVYQQWSHGSGRRAAFAFFTLASAFAWPKQVSAHAAGDHWLVLSSRKPDGTWEIRIPPRFADRLSLRNFMDRLKPETRQQRISKVKHFVDELLDSGYEGTIHLEKIAEGTGYRRTAVRDALLALQDSGHYRLYQTLEGVIAVGRKAAKMGTTVTAATFRHSWLARLACLGPAVSVGIWFAKDLVLHRPFEVWGFAAMIPLAYGGEWLNTRFRKWREDKE